jgi:RNA polymerase sigma-70 factor (ECF subfamily)
LRERRAHTGLVSLEDLDTDPVTPANADADIDESRALERLSEFLRQLNPVDRQVIVCYLEGLGGDAISEVTGVSPANVAMKVSRVKQALGRRFGKEFGRGN